MIGARIASYVNVTSGDESALKTAIAVQGPVAVGIDAAHKSLSFYSHGVYYEPDCKNGPDDLDHAVLAVGYGTLNGEDYWLVKVRDKKSLQCLLTFLFRRCRILGDRKKMDCSLNCSVDWLIGWLCDWTFYRLIDWLIDPFFVWLIDWLIGCVIEYSVDWLIDWLFHWSILRLIDWLIVRLNILLIDWLIDLLYFSVQNSWSTYWGDDGYVLMSRKDNNCGVTTGQSHSLHSLRSQSKTGIIIRADELNSFSENLFYRRHFREHCVMTYSFPGVVIRRRDDSVLFRLFLLFRFVCDSNHVFVFFCPFPIAGFLRSSENFPFPFSLADFFSFFLRFQNVDSL